MTYAPIITPDGEVDHEALAAEVLANTWNVFLTLAEHSSEETFSQVYARELGVALRLVSRMRAAAILNREADARRRKELSALGEILGSAA